MPRKKHSDDDKPLSIERARAEIDKAVFKLLAGNDPGPVFSHLKRPRKASTPYALKLTLRERESLIACAQLKGALKKKTEETGQGSNEIDFTRRQLKKLNDELLRAVAYAKRPHQRRLVAVMGKVANLLVGDYVGHFVHVSIKTGRATPKKANK